MIKKFWCWLWGHKFVGVSEEYLGGGTVEYTYRVLKFCLRCGKKNDEY